MKRIIKNDKKGIYVVDDKSPFDTKTLLLGNITLRLQGNLEIKSSGKYQFYGTLKSYDDRYDFNKSSHRSFIGELLTFLVLKQKGYLLTFKFEEKKQ